MKKTMRLLSMAALALVGAVMTGCSSDDNIDQPQQPETPNNVVTLTTTVSLGDGDATTRALTSTGVKTFAEGETMAIIYKNKSNQTMKAVSEPLPAGDYGASATFTFTLEAPSRTGNVTYIYPAAMAAATVATDAAVDAEANVNYAALATQDGTLATLSSSLDYCTKSGAWDSDNLPTATLENQLAILSITLKNSDGSSDITSTIKGMTLSDGTNSYAVTRSAVAGPIYVAIRPTASASIDIIATDGKSNYTKTLSGKTYKAGNGYNVSWSLAPTTLSLTSPTVGQVIGSDGKNYAAGSVPTGVTAVAMIAYVSGSNGLALALADEGSKNWSTAVSTAEAHTPIFTGGTWKLPTQDEWKNMFKAFGGSDASSSGLNAALAAAGGNSSILQESDNYWSSTPDGSYAYIVGLWQGEAFYDEDPVNYTNFVRACLAF